MQHGYKQVYNLSGGYATYACVYCQASGDKCGGSTCGVEMDFSESGDFEVHDVQETGEVIKVNACGLQCPGPIMQVYNALEAMASGDVLEIKATDPGFKSDIKVWTEKTGNTLLNLSKEDKTIVARIMKGQKGFRLAEDQLNHDGVDLTKQQTMVVFSGDLDKAIASLIIANGAASMGKEVTMFYTFWGLNILRKQEKVFVKKDFIGKMFSGMMPRGTQN